MHKFKCSALAMEINFNKIQRLKIKKQNKMHNQYFKQYFFFNYFILEIVI